jgi:hypothetical protein
MNSYTSFLERIKFDHLSKIEPDDPERGTKVGKKIGIL